MTHAVFTTCLVFLAMGNPTFAFKAHKKKLAETQKRKRQERLAKLVKKPLVKGFVDQLVKEKTTNLEKKLAGVPENLQKPLPEKD